MPNPIVYRRIISPMFRRGGGSPVQIGTIFENNFSAADWTEAGTGSTWTYNPSYIDTVNSTPGSYSSLIRYNAWPTQLEHFSITSTVTVNTISASNYFSFAIGLAGISEDGPIVTVKGLIYAGDSVYKGFMQIVYGLGNNNSDVVSDIGVSRVPLNAGDVLEMTLSQDFLLTTFSCRNVTQGSITYSCTFNNSAALSLPFTANRQTLNVNEVSFFNIEGDYRINSYSYSTTEYKNIFGLLVGDSKSEGYFVDSDANRISTLVDAGVTNYFSLAAGGGNVTQDILNNIDEIILKNPTNAVLFIGRNDLGVTPEVTWKANYASIVSQLQAAGINVWHQLPTPEAVLDQSVLTTYINSTYPANRIISVPAGWVVGTDVSSDGIHLTIAGALKVANNILTYL